MKHILKAVQERQELSIKQEIELLGFSLLWSPFHGKKTLWKDGQIYGHYSEIDALIKAREIFSNSL